MLSPDVFWEGWKEDLRKKCVLGWGITGGARLLRKAEPGIYEQLFIS